MNEPFSFDTIKDFDEHIALSIPNYYHITELVKSISTYFIKPGTNVYDIGCSTGSLLNYIALNNIESGITGIEYIGYEKSENFLKQLDDVRGFNFKLGDLTDPSQTPMSDASFIISVFTLQFIPISERWKLMHRIYDGIKPGGAAVIVEKVYVKDGFMQDVFTFSYYDYKRKTFTEKEILDKQADLRLIMSPQTTEQNLLMFRNAGFNCIENFFTSLLFKGWLLCK